jgi:hypothetical protein
VKNREEEWNRMKHGGKRNLNVAEQGEFGQTASLKRLNTAQN